MPAFGLGQTLFEMRYQRSMQQEAVQRQERQRAEDQVTEQSNRMAQLGMQYGVQERLYDKQQKQAEHQERLQGMKMQQLAEQGRQFNEKESRLGGQFEADLDLDKQREARLAAQAQATADFRDRTQRSLAGYRNKVLAKGGRGGKPNPWRTPQQAALAEQIEDHVEMTYKTYQARAKIAASPNAPFALKRQASEEAAKLQAEIDAKLNLLEYATFDLDNADEYLQEALGDLPPDFQPPKKPRPGLYPPPGAAAPPEFVGPQLPSNIPPANQAVKNSFFK